MKLVSATPDSATVELSMEELGLVINAIWQDLGYQEARTEAVDPSLREAYKALARAVIDVTKAMDALLPTSDIPEP